MENNSLKPPPKGAEIVYMTPAPRNHHNAPPQKSSSSTGESQTPPPVATRHDIHLPRRLFHMSMGVFAATVYNLFVTRDQAIAIVGASASVLYLLEQIRINYPRLADPITWLNRFLLRAEERLKESSSVPMAIAILLTILTFPKPAAVIGIYVLGIGDPLAAIVGINWGKTKLLGNKSIEGSLAFGLSVFVISYTVLVSEFGESSFSLFFLCVMVSFTSTLLELIPLKIDDNLTIPLYTALLTWIFASVMGFAI